MRVFKYLRATDFIDVDFLKHVFADNLEMQQRLDEIEPFQLSWKLKSMLEESIIYVTQLSKFNDIEEGFAYIKCDNENIKEFDRVICEGNKDIEDGNINVDIEAIDNLINFKCYLNFYWAACFSLRNDLRPMWALYADEFRGVCLEYEIEPEMINELNNFKILHKERFDIIYGELAYKICDLRAIAYLNDRNMNIINFKEGELVDDLRIATSKKDCWKTEEEVRLIFKTENVNIGNKIHAYVSIPKESLKSIQFGARIDKSIENQIRDLLRDQGNIEIKKEKFPDN